MGYRSHGYIVFPEALLAYWNGFVPDTSLDEFESVDRSDGYVTLMYSGWKWYDSYDPIKQIEMFLFQLENWSYENRERISDKDTYTREELESGEYPWVLDITLSNAPAGTINNFEMATYDSIDWGWAFSQQGEDTEDYRQEGNIESGLYQDRLVENPWGYLEGHAWQVALPMTLDEKDITTIGDLLQSLEITSSDYEWDEVKPYNAKYPPYRSLTFAVEDGKTRVIPCFDPNDKLVGFERTDKFAPITTTPDLRANAPDPDNFVALPQAILDKINAAEYVQHEIGELTARAHWNDSEIYAEFGQPYEIDIYLNTSADQLPYRMEIEPLKNTWAGGSNFTDNPELLGIDQYKSLWRGP